MKTAKWILTCLLIPVVIIGWSGCSKDDSPTEAQTYSITVKVEYPDNYNQPNADSALVTLKNIETSDKKTGYTNASGDVVFSKIVPGTYEVSASRSLTPAKASVLTGIASAVELNVVKTNISITSSPSEPLKVKLGGSKLGSIVIKEVYYTGSKTASGGSYFSDQFIEVYNNSTEVVYLDSLCIGDVYGNSGLINPNSKPTGFQSDQDHVYLSNVWMIPGNGKDHALLPGQSAVIAQDGINHKSDPNGNPNSPVDLSGAEWESFNQRDDNKDLDAPGVRNLSRLYFTGGFDWLVATFGPGMVIFKVKDFTTLEQIADPTVTTGTPIKRVKVPNMLVIDAVEALQNAESGTFKRIPAVLDGGFTFATGTYTGESIRRKVAATIGGRRVLKDTNNSSNDFELISKPTPKAF